MFTTLDDAIAQLTEQFGLPASPTLSKEGKIKELMAYLSINECNAEMILEDSGWDLENAKSAGRDSLTLLSQYSPSFKSTVDVDSIIDSLIQRRITDFHGLSLNDLVYSWISIVDALKLAGIRRFQVITGKGLHSVSGPILRPVLIHLAQQSEAKAVINKRNSGIVDINL